MYTRGVDQRLCIGLHKTAAKQLKTAENLRWRGRTPWANTYTVGFIIGLDILLGTLSLNFELKL